MRSSRLHLDAAQLFSAISPKHTTRAHAQRAAKILKEHTAEDVESVLEQTAEFEANTHSNELTTKKFAADGEKKKRRLKTDITFQAGPSSPGSVRTSPRKRVRGITGETLLELDDRAVPQPLDESDFEDGDIEDGASSAQTSPAKAPRRRPARKGQDEDGNDIILAPDHWEEVYTTIYKMRRPGGKAYPAVVDTMGCESIGKEADSPKNKRLETLIALMCSSQTKDTVTAAAIKNLRENLPGGLCLDGLLQVEPAKLNELIHAVGFHNNKTRYIKATAEILRDKFDGDIPDSIVGLTSLPGVGPKMAYLCLSSAWGRTEGIGVDVHVHRITNLLGWHKTKGPEETRLALQGWLPKEKWHEINNLLVGLGQTICAPIGRKCWDCDVGEKRLCPGRVRGGAPKTKTIKKERVVKREDMGDMEVKEEIKIEEEVAETEAQGKDSRARIEVKIEVEN